MSAEFTQQLVETIFKVVLSIALPIVSVYAIKLIRQGMVYIDSKTTVEQRTSIAAIVKQGVLMAEQLGENATLKGIVYDKKQEALAYIQAAVDRAGLTVNVTDLEALIEATVMAEFNKDVAVVTTPPVAPAPPGLPVPMSVG